MKDTKIKSHKVKAKDDVVDTKNKTSVKKAAASKDVGLSPKRVEAKEKVASPVKERNHVKVVQKKLSEKKVNKFQKDKGVSKCIRMERPSSFSRSRLRNCRTDSEHPTKN